MPAVSALAPPNGWPLAKTKSPGRKLAESPIAAAGRSPASTLIMATSRSGSHPLTSARNARSSGSTTVAKRWTTWALVTMWPSGRQMTPEPYPELRPWTRTGLDVDDDQSRSAREAERVRERLRQSNRMQRQAKVAAGDVAAREELVADATDRRDGDGHRRVS